MHVKMRLKLEGKKARPERLAAMKSLHNKCSRFRYILDLNLISARNGTIDLNSENISVA